MSSGQSRAIGLRGQSFLIAAGYFLVRFAYFKTETLFIPGSFSLSARHSSKFSPAHHLFYNETHHSYGMVSSHWVHWISSQSETRPKASHFFLQLELSLFCKGCAVHALKTQEIHWSCCVTYSASAVIYNLPSFIVTTYWRMRQSHTSWRVFQAYSM